MVPGTLFPALYINIKHQVYNNYNYNNPTIHKQQTYNLISIEWTECCGI